MIGQREPSLPRKIVAVVLLLIFLLFMLALVIVGVSSLKADHDLSRHHAAVRGFVDEVGSLSSGGAKMWVTFTTEQGKIMRHVEVDWDGHSDEGDAVLVEYLPSDPEIARVGDRGRSNALVMTIIGSLGIVGLGYGVLNRGTKSARLRRRKGRS